MERLVRVLKPKFDSGPKTGQRSGVGMFFKAAVASSLGEERRNNPAAMLGSGSIVFPAPPPRP